MLQKDTEPEVEIVDHHLQERTPEKKVLFSLYKVNLARKRDDKREEKK